MDYLFSMAISVDSVELLYKEALKVAEGAGIENPDLFLRNADDGGIDVEGCLQMVIEPDFIPGCSVYGSEASQASELDEEDDE